MFGGEEESSPQLLQFSNDGGPDDLATVPTRPLEYPDPTIALLPPIKDGPSRADAVPKEDAILALGGTVSREQVNWASADPELAVYSTRFGYNPTIRRNIDAEDLEFRRNNDGLLLERVFEVNLYFNVYRPQSLDPYDELQKLRRANVRTPAAPPDPRR